jgi:hypothetical protein
LVPSSFSALPPIAPLARIRLDVRAVNMNMVRLGLRMAGHLQTGLVTKPVTENPNLRNHMLATSVDVNPMPCGYELVEVLKTYLCVHLSTETI